MPKKKTHEEFIREVLAISGNDYDVIGHYINSQTKLLMKHNVCGNEYLVMPNKFLQGRRCPRCKGKALSKARAFITEKFIQQIKDKVGDEYCLLDEYINNHTKVLLIHKSCQHQFYITPNNFLNGRRCPKCAHRLRVEKNSRTDEEFKDIVKKKTNDNYRVLGKYQNGHTKIRMLHNKCGYHWMITPSSFLNGVRCPSCNGGIKRTHDEFVEKVNKLGNNEYAVVSQYINSQTNIILKHLCGYEWYVHPNNFIQGQRCPKCEFDSAIVKKTELWLLNNNVRFQREFIIKECRDKRALRFDFAIFDDENILKFLLELDGMQHFRCMGFGLSKEQAEQKFQYIQNKDRIKNEYCDSHNLRLIRIPYWEKRNIELILNNLLKTG